MRSVNLFFYFFRALYCQELSPTLLLRITELFSCIVFKSITVRMLPHFESFFSIVISEPITVRTLPTLLLRITEEGYSVFFYCFWVYYCQNTTTPCSELWGSFPSPCIISEPITVWDFSNLLLLIIRRFTLFPSVVSEPITVRMLPNLVINCEDYFFFSYHFRAPYCRSFSPLCCSGSWLPLCLSSCRIQTNSWLIGLARFRITPSWGRPSFFSSSWSSSCPLLASQG